MADSCIFCRIARGEIPAQMVTHHKEMVAFRDLNPQAPVHILIVPTKHISSLDDATGPRPVAFFLALHAYKPPRGDGGDATSAIP